MIRTIVAGVAAAAALGSMLVSVDVAANPRGGQSMNSASHGNRHHRVHRFYSYVPYYYGYGYGYGSGYVVDDAPPPAPSAAKPVAEKPAAESKRGCEPQTYSVPAAGGGESQVTVLRC